MATDDPDAKDPWAGWERSEVKPENRAFALDELRQHVEPVHQLRALLNLYDMDSENNPVLYALLKEIVQRIEALEVSVQDVRNRAPGSSTNG